jgi:hypothetical protein
MKKTVGQTVYIKAIVTAVNPDGTAKLVEVAHSPEGGIYLYTIDADQSTTEVLD